MRGACVGESDAELPRPIAKESSDNLQDAA